MQIRSFTCAAIAAAALVPFGARAQFTADPYHTVNVFGPNTLGFTPGLRVSLGASGTNGMFGTATRDGTESCDGPLSVRLDNLGNLGVPQQANGAYFPSSFGRICTRPWQLALTVGTSQLNISTQDLVGAPLLPFVSGASLQSSSDGRVHTFQWPAAQGADRVHIAIWDRSALPPQLLSFQSYPPATTSFVINLNQPGPYFNDRPYTFDVRYVAERNDATPSGSFVKALSSARTFFEFALPSTPLTTAPVPLSSGGAVTTGPAQGAATADQPSAASVAVPEAALVSVSLTPGPEDTDVPPDSLAFWNISIPDPADPSRPLYFGVGTRWFDCYERVDDKQGDRKGNGYDRDGDRYKDKRYGRLHQTVEYLQGTCNLVVNALRIDRSRIGRGTGRVGDAQQILKQRLYYKPDEPTERAPANPPRYTQLYLCSVTSGPYPGEPCVLYAKVYTESNLPTNVPNPQEYLDDYEAVILTNENGRIYLR